MRDLLIFAVVTLVAEGGRWGQEERAGDNSGDKWKTKQEERVLSEGFAVFCCEGIGQRGREGSGGERRHDEDRGV